MKLEIGHRKASDVDNFDPFAGPFDITIIKLDKQVNFNSVVIHFYQFTFGLQDLEI